MESYAHKAAKQVFIEWLRGAMAGNDGWSFCGMSGRVNRGAPNYGVWEEYPICENGLGANTVWDEKLWWIDYIGQTVHGSKELGRALWFCGSRTDLRYEFPRDLEEDPTSARPPTYDELVAIGKPPKAILDIAVQHKGSIIYGIEIVHKHGLTEQKRAFLKQQHFTTLVLDADWVLRQIDAPQKLTVLEVIGGGWIAEHIRRNARMPAMA